MFIAIIIMCLNDAFLTFCNRNKPHQSSQQKFLKIPRLDRSVVPSFKGPWEMAKV